MRCGYIRWIWDCGNTREVEEKHTGRYGARGQKRQKRRKATPEEIAKQNQVGTCPHCGATGIYKAQGKTEGVWGHGMNCFIAQRYKDDGAVIRYVEIEKIYRLD